MSPLWHSDDHEDGGIAHHDEDECTLGVAAAQRREPALSPADRFAGMAFTHGLTRVFALEHPVARWPRGMALALLDAMPPVKKAFTRAMLFGMS